MNCELLLMENYHTQHVEPDAIPYLQVLVLHDDTVEILIPGLRESGHVVSFLA